MLPTIDTDTLVTATGGLAIPSTGPTFPRPPTLPFPQVPSPTFPRPLPWPAPDPHTPVNDGRAFAAR